MKKNKIDCPACGSIKIKDIQTTETRQLTLGSEFSYLIPVNKCEDCGEEGDFRGIADSIREKEIERAREFLAKDLIESISQTGMKLAYVERSFEIPQRTISSKWGSGKLSASGLALLRIVKAMPWIVHIADHKFSADVIRSTIHIVWEKLLQEQNITISYSASLGAAKEIKVHMVATEQQNKLNTYEGATLVTSST